MQEKKAYVLFGHRTGGGKHETIGTVKATSKDDAEKVGRRIYPNYVITHIAQRPY